MSNVRDWPETVYRQLIDALGREDLGAALDLKPVSINAMVSRGRIPPKHWPAVVHLAVRKGVAIDGRLQEAELEFQRAQQADRGEPLLPGFGRP